MLRGGDGLDEIFPLDEILVKLTIGITLQDDSRYSVKQESREKSRRKSAGEES